ncbi:MAG: hypothetical protein MJ188_03655 [Treponema sp.]|nr:hypothetical protein [Treponema sp.]
MKKTFFNFSVLLLSAILLFGCASKPAGTSDEILEPENDLTFQIFNMSSYDVLVWPELVLENGPTHVLSNEDIVLSGETLAVHLNSKDLIKEFEDWRSEQSKSADKSSGWLTFGVRRIRTKEESITTCFGFYSAANKNIYTIIKDDIDFKVGYKTDNLIEVTTNADCNYTFKNNTNEAVYVANCIFSETGEKIASSERKLLQPGKEVTFSYNINTLRKKYPDCNLGIEYIGQYSMDLYVTGWVRNFNSLTDKMIYNINNLYESNNNYLQTSTDTTTDEWKTSTWTNSGDNFFKSVDGKKVKFSEKSSENYNRVYSNYFTDKVNGFEAEVTKFSGDEVGSSGYGFTFCEDLNKGKAYLLTITTVGLFRIWEINNGQWKSLIPADENGRTFRVSSALNCAYGVKDKVTVKRVGKDIQIFFNDELAWIIQNAKLPSGNTRFFASHNGNANETTEIDFEYLKFQF